jgi:hypothetical protein
MTFSSCFLSLTMSMKSLIFYVAAVLFSRQALGQHQEIHQFINQWHEAAARADGATFFGSMAENSIYIGTDAKERWIKNEFISFAKPYFDKGKAWDFKPYDRDLHVSADGHYVWFSELLTTWMGVCRGSGVIHKTNEGFKIEQYHLSVTIPNDIVKDFITLVDNFNKQKK